MFVNSNDTLLRKLCLLQVLFKAISFHFHVQEKRKLETQCEILMRFHVGIYLKQGIKHY